MKIVANLKMNMGYKETLSYLKEIEFLKDKVIFCPTSLFIPLFLEDNFKVGIQNISTHDLSSQTGQIAASQASEMGVTYALIGHSEVRNHYQEEDKEISTKIEQALQNNLQVILCIGEHKGEDKKIILRKQLEEALQEQQDLTNIIIAYEPIWAIGTGIIPTNEEIEATIQYIKELYPNVSVLYGGSVDENNISTLKNISNVDGFLIGKASCDIRKLSQIIRTLNV